MSGVHLILAGAWSKHVKAWSHFSGCVFTLLVQVLRMSCQLDQSMARHIGRTVVQWKLSFLLLQSMRRRLLHGPLEALEEEFETDDAMDNFRAYIQLSWQLLMDEVNRTHR